jgi:dTDP-4-dehydrorhamnose reductase
MNILLLGANGQLGRSFLDHGALATLGEVTPASRDGKRPDGSAAVVADLSAPHTLPTLLDSLKPALIVNAAAYTAVDRGEQEEDLATRVNGEAVGVIGQWAAAHDALVVHYSTDYVFDGSASTPYLPNAATAPVNAYGRSKRVGENALRASGARHLLLRTAWVYAPHSNNFLRTMLRLGAEREELRVVADQYGAPTSTDLIVDGTLAAVRAWQRAGSAEREAMQGTHHLVSSGHTSWHGFATALLQAAQANGLLARAPKVIPISTAEFPTPAKRPAWSVLDNSSFVQRSGYALPDWQDGLRPVIEKLRNQAA